MLRCPVRACLAVGALAAALAGLPRVAQANGRLPATSSITFRQGHDADVVAGLTFGLVISHDGGKTWAWMCDDAIGINGGPYDPTYAYSPTDTLFATTLAGLVAMRDGCTFGPTTEGKSFVTTDALGPDGALYFGAAQTADAAHGIAADFNIYRSADDDATPPTGTKPGDPADVNVYWVSILVAPSDKRTVYVSGFRYIPAPGDLITATARFGAEISHDDGTIWAPVAGAPHTGCLTENAAGELWACTRTTGSARPRATTPAS